MNNFKIGYINEKPTTLVKYKDHCVVRVEDKKFKIGYKKDKKLYKRVLIQMEAENIQSKIKNSVEKMSKSLKTKVLNNDGKNGINMILKMSELEK